MRNVFAQSLKKFGNQKKGSELNFPQTFLWTKWGQFWQLCRKLAALDTLDILLTTLMKFFHQKVCVAQSVNQIRKRNEIFPEKDIIKTFTWLQKLQFWQPCRNFFANTSTFVVKTAKIFNSKSGNNQNFENSYEEIFLLNYFSGHVKNSFDNVSGNVSSKFLEIFAQKPQTFSKRIIFFRKIYLLKMSGHLECSFDNAGRLFSTKVLKFFSPTLKNLKIEEVGQKEL